MARRVVVSEATGETFIFDDDWNDPDGRVRQLEYTLEPNSPAVPPHFHPATAQTFEVISGSLGVRAGKRQLVLGPGERATTAPGETHSQWNAGSDVVRAIECYDPPLAIEPFFTVLPHALGSKNPFKIAILSADFRHRSGQGTAGLRVFVTVFSALGRLAGLSGWYRPILDKAALQLGASNPPSADVL